MHYVYFNLQGAGVSCVTDLQYDPGGLSVAVIEGGGRRRRKLSQQRQTEEDGSHHQAPKHRVEYCRSLIITFITVKGKD